MLSSKGPCNLNAYFIFGAKPILLRFTHFLCGYKLSPQFSLWVNEDNYYVCLNECLNQPHRLHIHCITTALPIHSILLKSAAFVASYIHFGNIFSKLDGGNCRGDGLKWWCSKHGPIWPHIIPPPWDREGTEEGRSQSKIFTQSIDQKWTNFWGLWEKKSTMTYPKVSLQNWFFNSLFINYHAFFLFDHFRKNTDNKPYCGPRT